MLLYVNYIAAGLLFNNNNNNKCGPFFHFPGACFVSSQELSPRKGAQRRWDSPGFCDLE